MQANHLDGAGACGRVPRTRGDGPYHGQRVQLSVFQFRLSSQLLRCLLNEVKDVIDTRLDSVIVYRFPDNIGKYATQLGRPP